MPSNNQVKLKCRIYSGNFKKCCGTILIGPKPSFNVICRLQKGLWFIARTFDRLQNRYWLEQICEIRGSKYCLLNLTRHQKKIDYLENSASQTELKNNSRILKDYKEDKYRLQQNCTREGSTMDTLNGNRINLENRIRQAKIVFNSIKKIWNSFQYKTQDLN